MAALYSLKPEPPAWMTEPEVLWERRLLAAEDERDVADGVRLGEQGRFRGGDTLETEA